MERAERTGLSLAVLGHLALLAILSIGIAHRVPPVKPIADTIDVQLVDQVGLRSAAPEPATEAPRQMEAPTSGPPAEAAPAPAPEPTPAPVKAAPPPTPTPPKPAPPKPIVKEAIAPPAPAKPAPPKLLPDILKAVNAAAKNERAASAGAGKAPKAAADKLGPDFLKGVLSASAAKGEHARAAISGPALNGLMAAIYRQVKPCYNLGALGGTSAMQITTLLDLRFNPDGSVRGSPQLVEQKGVDDSNRAYRQQMVEVSRRAVLQCAPLKLPAELYEGGWEHLQLNFIPGQMR